MRISLNGRFLTQDVTGVQRVAREVLVELDKMSQAALIEPPRLILPNAPVIQMPKLKAIRAEVVGKSCGHIWEQMELPRHIEDDVLLCLGNTAPIRSLLNRKTKVVCMVHDLSYKYFPEAYSLKFKAAYSFLIPLVLKFADRVVTVSKAEKGAIQEQYPFLKDNQRLSFLQNGGIPDHVREIAFREIPQEHGERSYGLYVGSLSKRKNAEGIMRSAVKFLEDNPGKRFVVIGATSSVFEEVELDIPSDIAQRIDMRGQINNADCVYDAYRAAIFLAFPSFYEASPLPPIEAMTFGCPVISSDIPSLRERCGDAAIYCDKNDIASISASMSRLTRDKFFWENKSEASKRQALSYSWRSQAKGLIDLCEEAVQT